MSQTFLEALDEVTEEVHQWVLFSARYRPSPEAIARFLEHRQLNLDNPQMAPEERQQGYEEAAQQRSVDVFCSLDTQGSPVPPQHAELFALLSTGTAAPIGLHIQADWLLVTTRRELVEPESNPWHQEIFAQLPLLLRAFLGWVCTRGNVPEERLPELYGVLPDLTDMGEASSRWLRTSAFTAALRQTLADLAFLPARTAEGLRFITVAHARLLPAPLHEFDNPGRQGWLLFGPHIVSTTLLGKRGLACLKELGCLTELAPQECAPQWEGGAVGHWIHHLGEQSRNALLRLLAGLAHLDASEVWRNTALCCLPSQTGGWIHRGMAKRLPGEWDAVPEEAPALKAWLTPFLPPAEQTLAWWLERLLQREAGANQYVHSIVPGSLETLVCMWWILLPEHPERHDIERVIAFTSWVHTKQRQRASLVRKVLCDAGNAITLCPWTEAVLADPYASTARRRFFQKRKMLSARYLESDQQASAADWHSFFEAASPELAGKFLMDEVAQELSASALQQALPGYRLPLLRRASMSSHPKWHGQEFSSGHYLLVDYHLPPQLRAILDDEITLEIADDIAQWLDEGRRKLPSQCKRRLVYIPSRVTWLQEQELPVAASWVQMLQDKRWVWDQQGSGPYTPREVLPRVDAARPEAPAVKLPHELVATLHQCGVVFGTAIPDMPALERLQREGPRATALRAYELLQAVMTAVADDDKGLQALRRLLETTPLLPVPGAVHLLDQGLGGRIPASRLVHTAVQRDFGSWLVPVSVLPEGSNERQLADLIGHVCTIPRGPTPHQALAFLAWVWRTGPDAETVRRVLPRAYSLLHEGIEQQTLAQAHLEAVLQEARVFTRSRRWVPAAAGHVYLEDIGDERLRELLAPRVDFATGGHLGETLVEQQKTADLLGLPRLSSRYSLAPRAVSEYPAEQAWQAGFQHIHDYLLLCTFRDEGDEDSTLLPPGSLTLVRCEGLHLAVLEGGEPLAYWEVNAACLDDRAVVVGEPIDFMAELCTALLELHGLSARRNLHSLGPEITQLLGLLDHPEKLRRRLEELYRKYGLQPVLSTADGGQGNEAEVSATAQTTDTREREGTVQSGAGAQSLNEGLGGQTAGERRARTPVEDDRVEPVEADGTSTPAVSGEGVSPNRKAESLHGRVPDKYERYLFRDGDHTIQSPEARAHTSIKEHAQQLPGHPGEASYTEERSDARLLSYIRNLLGVGVDPSLDASTSGGDGSSDEQGQFGNDAVFREAVLAFERARARFPIPKSEGQAGHDIDSFTHPEAHPARQLARRIEVKGRNTPWTDAEIVELSSRQFRDALERSAESEVLLAADFDFWLYVVEPDERGGYRVLPLRNPARRVARYQFRGGVWRHFAEQS